MSKSDLLFRKSALEKLASPESLDQLIKITSPMGWLTLSAIIFLLVGVNPTFVQPGIKLTEKPHHHKLLEGMPLYINC